MEENLMPLVSICVITYNSSKYIIETLESIKAQTYNNIELIISDDYSIDDTVFICKEWLKINEERFIRCRMIESNQNTGISSNCNRALKYSLGEWIKFIAGDDLLTKDCVQLNISYISSRPEILVLQSNTFIINESSNLIGKSSPIDDIFALASANFQYLYCCYKYSCNTTTLFMKKVVYEQIGGYDEEIVMMEDTPLWLRLTMKGYKLYFFDAYTTMYRRNLCSVSFNSGKDDKIYHDIYKWNILTSKKYILPYVNGLTYINERYRLSIVDLFLRVKFINKRNKMNLLLVNLLLSPYIILTKLLLFKLKIKIRKSICLEKKYY